MLQEVKANMKGSLPEELVDTLLDHYMKLKGKYFEGDYGSAELNGGKFVEAIVRVLQFETNHGSYTPFGTKLPDVIGTLRGFENLPKGSVPESYRLHIPRTVATIYHVRNSRGVGHVGGDVNPNLSDATLLITCADWTLAELVRLHYQCSLDGAQRMVDALIHRKLPLVHEVDEVKRIQVPGLTQLEQTLLMLAVTTGGRAPIKDLIRWIEPGIETNYRRRVLNPLHKGRLIEYNYEKDYCTILPMGLRLIDERMPKWMETLNGR